MISAMKTTIVTIIIAALLGGAALFLPAGAFAGSCCGGSAAAALVLPKSFQSMVDVSFDMEKYNGFWDDDGDYLRDPSGTRLWQYRLNLGYAQRLAPRWQAGVVVPYVWNHNKYTGLNSRSEGLGDMAVNLWYEAFDSPMCRLGWSSLGLRDLVPAATFGLSLTIPTGVSPYDDVSSSFDITGRGFYRLDGNMLLDKTIYPLSMSLLLSYGKYRIRPVNREYGEFVQPYHKQLGDRATGTLAVSYDTLIDTASARRRITTTATLSQVWEGESEISGDRDPTSGMKKTAAALAVAYSALDRSWSGRISWNHSITRAGWGRNAVASDIFSLGASRAFE